MSKALRNELELRLFDLLAKKAAEEKELSPDPLYLEDLAVTIGYVNMRLKALEKKTEVIKNAIEA